MSDVTILHISKDEKFIDWALESFDRCGYNSSLLVFSPHGELNYVKDTRARVVNPRDENMLKLKRIMSKYDIVILHSIFRKDFAFPGDAKIVWIGFGFDYYNYIYPSEMYLYSTRTCIYSFFSNPLRFLKENVLFPIKNVFNQDKKYIKNIDYFAPVLVNEFDIIKNKHPSFSCELIDWNYGGAAKAIESGFIPERVRGNNILFGNSATLNNNHLDILTKLKSSQSGSSKIIVPLSYGVEKYKNYLSSVLLSRFGENVEIIDSFLSLEEYASLVSSCAFAVMNHKRQQAMGNIIMLLFMGSKVFLNPINPAYEYFKENGLIVFSTDEINENALSSALSDKDMLHNRHKILELFSQDVIDDKTKSLVNKCI